MIKKRRRSNLANSDAVIPAGPDGYVCCPNSSYLGFVNLEVCRLKHFHWNDPPMGLQAATHFAKTFCRHCTFWKRYVLPERRQPVIKFERKTFLASPPKFVRGIPAASPAVKHRRVAGKNVRQGREVIS